MAPVYEYLSYRVLLRDQAIERKKQGTGWTLQKIAERALLQAPYLTNVLKERAHLNADQLFNLAQLFEWDEDETAYGSLLLEWERSGQKRRRDSLKRRIDEIRKSKMQSKAHLKKQVIGEDVAEYTKFFLNPFYSLLNSFLGIPKYSKNPKAIIQCLHIDPRQLQFWLKDLVNMKFIAPAEGGYAKIKKNFHLPKESPLCDPHQTLLQHVTNQHVQTLPEEEKYGFTVTFSADPETKDKIHREFLKFLKTIEPLVKDAPSEELYGMRFDLFRWSYDKSKD